MVPGYVGHTEWMLCCVTSQGTCHHQCVAVSCSVLFHHKWDMGCAKLTVVEVKFNHVDVVYHISNAFS